MSDDLIELARRFGYDYTLGECGTRADDHSPDRISMIEFTHDEFADLVRHVRAQERERCAALFDDDGELHSGLEVVHRIRSMG